MTSKSEKQFFDTFGIEPKYESHSCDGWGRTVEVKYFTDKKEAKKFGIVVSELEYPQITDRILLELICTTKGLVITQDCNSVGQLKDGVLKVLINLAQVNNDIKHQVCTLFEENN